MVWGSSATSPSLPVSSGSRGSLGLPTRTFYVRTHALRAKSRIHFDFDPPLYSHSYSQHQPLPTLWAWGPPPLCSTTCCHARTFACVLHADFRFQPNLTYSGDIHTPNPTILLTHWAWGPSSASIPRTIACSFPLTIQLSYHQASDNHTSTKLAISPEWHA